MRKTHKSLGISHSWICRIWGQFVIQITYCIFPLPTINTLISHNFKPKLPFESWENCIHYWRESNAINSLISFLSTYPNPKRRLPKSQSSPSIECYVWIGLLGTIGACQFRPWRFDCATGLGCGIRCLS